MERAPAPQLRNGLSPAGRWLRRSRRSLRKYLIFLREKLRMQSGDSRLRCQPRPFPADAS